MQSLLSLVKPVPSSSSSAGHRGTERFDENPQPVLGGQGYSIMKAMPSRVSKQRFCCNSPAMARTAMAAASACRPKQVTDPINDHVRAKLCHEYAALSHRSNVAAAAATADAEEPASMADSLANVFFYGLDEEDQNRDLRTHHHSRSGSLDCYDDGGGGDFLERNGHMETLQRLLRNCYRGSVEVILFREICRALQEFSQKQAQIMLLLFHGDQSSNSSKRRRDVKVWYVVSYLQSLGFDAGLCKSSWKDSEGCLAGEYAYADVLLGDHDDDRGRGTGRLFVDLEFRTQFEIARPTREYNFLLQMLPEIFVGCGDALRDIVRIMSECGKVSMKKRQMHVPPWRKYRYMQAKWFGSNSRITTSSLSNVCNLVLGIAGISNLNNNNNDNNKKTNAGREQQKPQKHHHQQQKNHQHVLQEMKGNSNSGQASFLREGCCRPPAGMKSETNYHCLLNFSLFTSELHAYTHPHCIYPDSCII